MNILFSLILAAITSGSLSSFITLVISRRKNNADTTSVELDNAQKVISIWKDLSDELNQQVKSLQIEVDNMKNGMKVLELKYKEQCETCEYKTNLKKE
jgi:hypothetical protein